MPGVPYVPNSASLNMTDISGYQPWKALSDFAMHNDMDQGAFQQLVRRAIFSWDFATTLAWKDKLEFKVYNMFSKKILKKIFKIIIKVYKDKH